MNSGKAINRRTAKNALRTKRLTPPNMLSCDGVS